jgi:hypothetical protein
VLAVSLLQVTQGPELLDQCLVHLGLPLICGLDRHDQRLQSRPFGVLAHSRRASGALAPRRRSVVTLG